ncbi:Glycosyl transferase family 2 [Lachnospiraceae bacterium]|nr:Glycosyl transferase family 2 [Lachnospiraceae bacterium]
MKQVGFVSIKKDEEKFERLIESVKSLNVPEGYSLNFWETMSEDGVAAAYEEARQASDADINIYIDGEAYIVNQDMLYELTAIFDQDERIAVVGVLGSTYIPTSGILEESRRKYGSIINSAGEVEKGVGSMGNPVDVMAVESFFVAVRGDISWRNDLFSGEAFLVTALCVEYTRAAKRIVVANTEKTWVSYNREYKKYSYYEKNNFLNEYSKDIYPLVSILIPTFQRPEYFELALNSAITQTYRNLDIFVTDNSKDDRTAKLMEKYLAEDSRIVYEHHPEYTGFSDNWNRAFEYAESNKKSEYINWLMDDDLFDAKKIEKMVDCYISQDGVSLVTSHRQRIDENGKYLKDTAFTQPIIAKTGMIDGRCVGNAILTNCVNFIGEPTTVLMKKSLLEGRSRNWSGNEKNYSITDFPTWLRLLEKGNMVYITDTLSFYRCHENQGGSNPKTLASGTICMALEIQYAIKKHIYLEDSIDIKMAYVSWIGLACQILRIHLVDAEGFDEKDKLNLQIIMKTLCDMSLYLADKGTENFVIDLMD